jgi:HK97 gp10 family phage protein
VAKQVIEVKGLRELAIAARRLTDEVKRKIAKDAVQAGAGVVSRAARNLAPTLQAKYQGDKRRTAGTLKRAIVAVPVRKGDYPEEVMSIVGIRLLSKKKIETFKSGSGKAGADNPRDPFYGVMVEVGTRAHSHRSKAIPGVRYLKNAFEGNARQAANRIRDVAGKRIASYGNRLAK